MNKIFTFDFDQFAKNMSWKEVEKTDTPGYFWSKNFPKLESRTWNTNSILWVVFFLLLFVFVVAIIKKDIFAEQPLGGDLEAKDELRELYFEESRPVFEKDGDNQDGFQGENFGAEKYQEMTDIIKEGNKIAE